MSLNMIDEETTAQTDDWAEAEDDEAMARFGISPNHLFGKEEAHQKQHHVPYSLAILMNGIFLLIYWIASTLWAFQYVFSCT